MLSLLAFCLMAVICPVLCINTVRDIIVQLSAAREQGRGHGSCVNSLTERVTYARTQERCTLHTGLSAVAHRARTTGRAARMPPRASDLRLAGAAIHESQSKSQHLYASARFRPRHLRTQRHQLLPPARLCARRLCQLLIHFSRDCVRIFQTCWLAASSLSSFMD